MTTTPLNTHNSATTTAIWAEWNAIGEEDRSRVKTNAKKLGLSNESVAIVVYPPDQFGVWDDDDEPMDLDFIPTEDELSEDEMAELYSEICDVIERNYQGMPLENCGEDEWKLGAAGNDPLFHTSNGARAAALRIFEILGIAQDG